MSILKSGIEWTPLNSMTTKKSSAENLIFIYEKYIFFFSKKLKHFSFIHIFYNYIYFLWKRAAHLSISCATFQNKPKVNFKKCCIQFVYTVISAGKMNMATRESLLCFFKKNYNNNNEYLIWLYQRHESMMI